MIDRDVLINNNSETARMLRQANTGEVVLANSTLPYEAHRRISEKLVEVTTRELVGVQDLTSAGLTYDLGNVGVTVLTWEQLSDMNQAQRSMDLETEPQRDRPTFGLQNVNIPIISKQWHIKWRTLQASINAGRNLDTISLTLAGRKVSENIERLLFNGDTSLGILGYTSTGNNHNTYATSGQAWTTGGTTNVQRIRHLIAIAETIRNDGYNGPYMLYMSNNLWSQLWEDYSSAKGDNTLRDRILALPFISDIRVTRELPDSRLLMVQMSDDVIEMAMAQDITNIEFSNNLPGVDMYVYACMTPVVKWTLENQSGICYANVGT